MPAPQRSHPGSLRSLWQTPSASPTARTEGMGSSVDDSLTNPLIRGLRDIFGRFAGRPDFSVFYESDIDRRLHKPWARVGDSMRLALGRQVRLVITHPDGARTVHVLGPGPSGEKHLAAVRQAEGKMEGPDADFLAGHVVITASREEASRLAALIDRSTGNVSEQG